MRDNNGMPEHSVDAIDALVAANLAAREAALSPWAARSTESRGRERPEEPSPLRTEFQRDRDRIIHAIISSRA
jgi:hypothetical protein